MKKQYYRLNLLLAIIRRVNMDMYLLKKDSNKFVVTCNRCHERGYVDLKCTECGGKGVRFKTVEKWVIKNVEIECINRDSDGGIRYWTDQSCFYEESNKLVHFTKKDAVRECERRNTEFSNVNNVEVILRKHCTACDCTGGLR
jgi:hypothetical protein